MMTGVPAESAAHRRGEGVLEGQPHEVQPGGETAPKIMHRKGGVRLGKTPLHDGKVNAPEPAANRQSHHPSYPTRKRIRGVWQPVFLLSVAPPIGCAVFGAVSGGSVQHPSVIDRVTVPPNTGSPTGCPDAGRILFPSAAGSP